MTFFYKKKKYILNEKNVFEIMEIIITYYILHCGLHELQVYFYYTTLCNVL